MKQTWHLILLMGISLSLVGCKNEYEKYQADQERQKKSAELAALAASFNKPAALPADELAKITGRGGLTGDYFQGTLYNGSSYTLAYVDIVLALKEEAGQFKKRERVLRAERRLFENETGPDGRTTQRRVAVEWPPFTAIDVNILSGAFSAEIGTNTLTWGVYNAYGFKR